MVCATCEEDGITLPELERITFFDTGDAYTKGANEELVGEALAISRRTPQ